MEMEKFETLNNLYKSLRKLDVDILSKFNCAEISDTDYFYHGINNDIVSNTLNIITNYLSGNIESAGVDNSCRIILEALIILAMDANGDIAEVQKSIYRYSYAYVDLENFKLVTTQEQLQDENYKKIKADRNKCANYIKRHFDCKYEDILKQGNGVDDPCFYLKKNLKDNIVFSKLAAKYFPKDMRIAELYEFFSIMVHPRCEMYSEAENATMEVHQHFVDNVINYAVNYLSSESLLKPVTDGNGFNEDFFFNPLLVANVHNVKEIETAFNLSIKNLCPLPYGFDWFTWFFLEKSKYIVLDMLISLSLGYREHVIATFKPFIELFSIFYNINTHEDLTEFQYLKESYWLSSRIQINEHLKNCGLQASNREYRAELEELYNKYYQEHYNVSTFNKFYDKYLHNSLYFLSNSKKSFSKFVREALEGISDGEDQGKDFLTLYKISKDMAHASGYSFNATVDLVGVVCHKVIYATIYVIRHLLVNAVETMKENNIDTELTNVISLFDAHIQIQSNAVREIYFKYNVDNE